MAYQTVKVSKPLLERFRAACSVRGDRVNTVLREAMEHYVSETPNETTIAALQEGDEMLRTDKGPWFYGSTEITKANTASQIIAEKSGSNYTGNITIYGLYVTNAALIECRLDTTAAS